MPLLERLLMWLTSRLPMRVINDGNRQYLERYYLFQLLGWTFYIHRFVGSDPDRGLHDHPWPKAYSIILRGWYWEETRSGVRKVRWFNSLTGDSFHRVVLPYWTSIYDLPSTVRHVPCWTLFFHREQRVKQWGFLIPLEGEEGAFVFTPFKYTGSVDRWWLTAPSRKQREQQSKTAHH